MVIYIILLISIVFRKLFSTLEVLFPFFKSVFLGFSNSLGYFLRMLRTLLIDLAYLPIVDIKN